MKYILDDLEEEEIYEFNSTCAQNVIDKLEVLFKWADQNNTAPCTYILKCVDTNKFMYITDTDMAKMLVYYLISYC